MITEPKAASYLETLSSLIEDTEAGADALAEARSRIIEVDRFTFDVFENAARAPGILDNSLRRARSRMVSAVSDPESLQEFVRRLSELIVSTFGKSMDQLLTDQGVQIGSTLASIAQDLLIPISDSNISS
jgi:hypothetical protein